MKAVVMAGGEGTRLRPLTSNQPKPMVPIVGQAVHGAHRRPAAAARDGRGRRHARLHAAGDPHVLRRRRVARRRHRLLGRGAAARHGRLGAARAGRARRDVPRDLGRRAVRRRPRRARRGAPGEGRRRHDRAQVGRQPARVRDRRHRRGRARRAVPREALLGPGLLGHDQHRDLRPRARGAPPRARRPPVRLLEGALPAAARDGPADLRARARRLLAGHRQPRPVPAGELRRARRPRAARRARPPAARQRLGQRGGRHRRGRARRGACVHRPELPDRRRRLDRAVLGALAGRDRARGRACDPQRDRRRHVPRPQRGRRGRDPRPRLRPPRPRARARGRRDRRPGHDRRRGEHLPGRPGLPVQGDRDRRPDPREHRLGDAGRRARRSAATARPGSSTST